MEDSAGCEYVDRLSELPESLIHHILSFLPTRDVVSTTLLSKRWENLWTTIPCLNFTNFERVWWEDEPPMHQVRNFVNQALICWKGTKLLKFTIEIRHNFEKSLAGDVDLWVAFAVENKVEELSIHLYEPDQRDWREDKANLVDEYIAPQCLYLCSSIKSLSLLGYSLRDHEAIAWNQLKSLSIDGFYITESLINRILLGAPRLEVLELALIDINVNLNISSTSLKRLMICKNMDFSGHQPSLDTVLRICCPRLEILQIYGVRYGKCLFTDVSSLTDAALDFCHPKDDHYGSKSYDARWIELVGEAMLHILSTFQHVERLTLSRYLFEMIRASQKKNVFSPLPNAVFLKVEVCSRNLVEMVDLLGIFPNLEMLVIDEYTPPHSPVIDAETCLEFETNVSESFLPQLKIVKISSDFDDSSMFGCIKFLLKHSSMLEKVDILAFGHMREEARLLEVEETLLSLPRSSPTAKVIFGTFLIGDPV